MAWDSNAILWDFNARLSDLNVMLCYAMLCYDCFTFEMGHVMTFVMPELLIHDPFNTRSNVSRDTLINFKIY